MAFDYFYGAQSQQFAFYRIPKVMFTDNRFQNISTEGKYSLQGTTQSRYLTGGVPPVRFSM
jgi:hypothetical protein